MDKLSFYSLNSNSEKDLSSKNVSIIKFPPMEPKELITKTKDLNPHLESECVRMNLYN